MIKRNGKGVKEIPIPGVTKVPSYETDYLPCFLERNTYIREKGGPRTLSASPTPRSFPAHPFR